MSSDVGERANQAARIVDLEAPAEGRAVTVDNTKLRLCGACRADVCAGRAADVLRDGEGRPYLDDANSPWAASGYGAWGDPVRAVLERRSDGRRRRS